MPILKLLYTVPAFRSRMPSYTFYINLGLVLVGFALACGPAKEWLRYKYPNLWPPDFDITARERDLRTGQETLRVRQAEFVEERRQHERDHQERMNHANQLTATLEQEIADVKTEKKRIAATRRCIRSVLRLRVKRRSARRRRP